MVIIIIRKGWIYMKKKISLATIICVGASAVIAILALFGVFKLSGVVSDVLFTTLSLTVAGILTINSCEMLEKKNKLALVSLSLIVLSTLLVVLCYWTNLDSTEFYMSTTFVVSVLSVCFSLITSNMLKMGKNYQLIQALCYTCYAILSLYLILIFLNLIELSGLHLRLFILFIILSFVAMCILAVLSKRQPNETTRNEYVKIRKDEYEDLLAKKAQLETLLKENSKND